jgi:tetratricopeptide (TPR) repeat protein
MSKILRSPLFITVLLVIGMATSGCVYYNTFYNARKSFNEAEKYRKQTGQGTQSGYKTAIDKSLKVVEDHPGSRYYDNALFVLGVSYYYTQQYNKSERRLRELLADFPNSKFTKEATLYLAKAKLKTGATDEGIALFDEIFAGKYGKETRAEAAMALGGYHDEQKDQAAALRYYMAVRDSLGDEKQRLQAQRFIADGYFDAYKFSDALKGYLQVLGLKPDHNQRYHALYSAAICSYRLQRINVGLDYLKQLSKDPLYFDSLGAIALAVGEGHEAAGDMELAENVYQDVAMTSKNNNWVGEAYYRLGLIYQFNYDNVSQAKTFYDKATKSAGGSLSGRDAGTRSTDIARLQALTKAGLDTAAVRMAQLGLDSLSPSDSIDIILEMRLPPPKDTSKPKDTSLAKGTRASRDSLLAARPKAGEDSTATADSLKSSSKDSTVVQDTTSRPSDSIVIRPSRSGRAAPQIDIDSSILRQSDSARKANDTGAHPSPLPQPPGIDTTSVPKVDSSAAKAHDTSATVAHPSPLPQPPGIDTTSVPKVDSAATKAHDTSATVAHPSPPPNPPGIDTTSAPKVDSSAAKAHDTSASVAQPSPLPHPPGIDTTSVQKIDSAATKPPDTTAIAASRSIGSSPLDSNLSIKGDSLSKALDSLANKGTDSTKGTGPDSLAARATDTSSQKNVTKTLGGKAPKPVKDSLTPAQIWKRINDAAESQYSLAELYWFQLDKPDSAVKELTDLLKIFPKSQRAPQAMIALSQMHRDYLNDTTGADSLLRLVLLNYPHSDNVPTALAALNLQGTSADTGYPEYYMHKAESFLFDQKDPDSARYYYRYVARQFPRSKFRDQAAFSAVWVVENFKNPGDSSVYYAYKSLSQALSGSPYAGEAAKRLVYNPPPPIHIPSAKDKGAEGSSRDTLLAGSRNLVAAQPAPADSANTYVDPRKAAYIGPKKEDLVLLELNPVQTTVEFVYPPEAYDLEGNQFQLYFQILLDVTGRVIDLSLKIPSSSDELNHRAELTVRSMTFDPLSVQKELQRKAINIILPDEQVDPRGRWYVFAYTISKPGFITR